MGGFEKRGHFAIILLPSRGEGAEPGQDGNVAALSELVMCGGFLFMKNDAYFMKRALVHAKKAGLLDEVPVGAIIVKDGKIIAWGHNTREGKNDSLGHAEINAIKMANKKLNAWRLDGCTMYVTVEPCIMCGGALIQSRIDRVVYGAKDTKGGAFGSSINILEASNINHHPEIIGGVLEEECSLIIKDYFKKKRIKK